MGACSANAPLPKPAADDAGVVQPLKGRDAGGNAYVWFWDPTPGRNPTRQLVRITPKKVGCTILFMPNADMHDFRLASRGRLPDKVTAASAPINTLRETGTISSTSTAWTSAADSIRRCRSAFG